MQQAAEAAGLAFVFNPVTGGMLTESNVEEQAEAIAGSEGPVVAYCASGNRSTIVWALGVAGDMPVDEILRAPRRTATTWPGCGRSSRRWRPSATLATCPTDDRRALVIAGAGIYVCRRDSGTARARPPRRARPEPRPMPRQNRTDWLDRLADRVFRGLIWLMHRLPWRARIRTMGWLFAHVVGPIAGYGGAPTRTSP
jgi:hypothetical protein